MYVDVVFHYNPTDLAVILSSSTTVLEDEEVLSFRDELTGEIRRGRLISSDAATTTTRTTTVVASGTTVRVPKLTISYVHSSMPLGSSAEVPFWHVIRFMSALD